MGLKIRYVDFWPGFRPESFLFTKILEKITKGRIEIVSTVDEKVDLQFNSVFCFGSRRERANLKAKSLLSDRSKVEYELRLLENRRSNSHFPASKYVWYTGENKRHPVDVFDYTIGFDKTDPKFRNLYFPYWMTRVDWGFGKSEFEIMPTVTNLMSSRVSTKASLAACTFSSKMELNRLRVIQSVESLIPVTKFGLQYNNETHSKHETAKGFGLQICMENQIFPGYVTEKIQEAWISRNVPIWAGIQTITYFNPAGMIDVTNLNRTEIEEVIGQLTVDMLEEMQCQPILILEPSLAPLTRIFEELIP